MSDAYFWTLPPSSITLKKTAVTAAELRSRYNLNLLDALQVASALAGNCDALLTNDLALKRVTELPILVLDELELSDN